MNAGGQKETGQQAFDRTVDAEQAGRVFSAMRADGSLSGIDHDMASELALAASGNTFAAAAGMGAGADAGDVPPGRMYGMVMEAYYDAVVEDDHRRAMAEVREESTARLNQRLGRLARHCVGGSRGLMGALSDFDDSRIRQIEEDFVFS